MLLWSERILLALLETNPLAEDAVYWTDVRGETVLLSQYDPGHELEDLLMSALVSLLHDLTRGIIKSLVAADIGANFSGLTYRELRDRTGPTRVGFSAH